MGLMIHSLGEIPADAERDYYLYLLDYGWKEPFVNTLNENFAKMADKASKTNSVVFRGTVGHHFSDEVLSWHSINGMSGRKILPAILITTKNPNEFHRMNRLQRERADHKLLLISVRDLCDTPSEVIPLIEKIFADIETKRVLQDFSVAKEMKAGKSNSIVDALILEPNFNGLGVDLRKILDFFRRRNSKTEA